MEGSPGVSGRRYEADDLQVSERADLPRQAPFSTLRCRYGPADLSQCTYRLFAAERAGSMLKSQGSDKGREKNAATRTLRPFVGKRSSTLISGLLCFSVYSPIFLALITSFRLPLLPLVLSSGLLIYC